MTYYLIKIETLSKVYVSKVPEKEMNAFIETAKRLNWKISFIG